MIKFNGKTGEISKYTVTGYVSQINTNPLEVLVKELSEQVVRLTEQRDKYKDRIDVVSDQLDYEIGNRIFYKKRCERLEWFIRHLSEQLRKQANEADTKLFYEGSKE